MTPRFEDSILEALMPRGSRILTHSDLSQKILGSQPEAADVAAFERALYGLERRGAVVRVRGEKLSRIEFTEFQAGTIVFKGEGKAFLLSGIPRVPDTPIARGGAGSAMDGDFVLVRLEKARKPVGGRGPRPATRGPLFFGTVVKVLVRRHETVVGKIARGP
ncbi:MAG: hypothetical protein JNK60_15795, partial [Acidobacteria bacterium]|nr:hypothetical protein [Acidobacteriota bacterium]